VWWLLTTVVGAASITSVARSMHDARCAQDTADAVALALTTHGEEIGSDLARLLGVTVRVWSGDPVTVRVDSSCGTAVASAVREDR